MPPATRTSADRSQLETGNIIDCNQSQASVTVMLPTSLHTDGCCTTTISQKTLQSALGVGNAAFKNVHEIEATAIQNGTGGHLGISLFHDDGSKLHTNTRATHITEKGSASQHHFVAPVGLSTKQEHTALALSEDSFVPHEAQKNAVRQMARWKHFLPDAGQSVTKSTMMKGVKTVKSTLADGSTVTSHAVPIESPGASKSSLGPIVQMVQANCKNPMFVSKVFGAETKGAVPTVEEQGKTYVTLTDPQLHSIQSDLKNNLTQKSQFESGGLTIGAARLDDVAGSTAEQKPTFVRLTFKRTPVDFSGDSEVEQKQTAMHIHDALEAMKEPPTVVTDNVAEVDQDIMGKAMHPGAVNSIVVNHDLGDE
jgi:5-carboxymethyl-2-hydroxymuconate isomerase